MAKPIVALIAQEARFEAGTRDSGAEDAASTTGFATHKPLANPSDGSEQRLQPGGVGNRGRPDGGGSRWSRSHHLDFGCATGASQ